MNIIKGIFIGAFIYAVSYFCFTVFGTNLEHRKLDFSGNTGGKFILTAICFILGAIVGAFIGAVQPKIKTTIIVSSIIAVMFLIMVLPPLYNSYLRYLLEENKYWVTFTEIFIWVGLSLIFVFNNWLIAKTTLPKKVHSVELEYPIDGSNNSSS